MTNREPALFLGSAEEIQEGIAGLVKGSGSLKLAVAFVRRHWRRFLADYKGRVQVICWLNTNTDPIEVEAMMDRPNIMVRQLDSMHAKVYLAPGAAAVIGSANLSEAALGDSGTAGNYEAAVLITDRECVREIGAWFDETWEAAHEITARDLIHAKERFEAAPLSHPSDAQDQVRQNGSPNLDAIVETPSDPGDRGLVAPNNAARTPELPPGFVLLQKDSGINPYEKGAARSVFEAMCEGTVGGVLDALPGSKVTKYVIEDHAGTAPRIRDGVPVVGRGGFVWLPIVGGVVYHRGISPSALAALPRSTRVDCAYREWTAEESARYRRAGVGGRNRVVPPRWNT